MSIPCHAVSCTSCTHRCDATLANNDTDTHSTASEEGAIARADSDSETEDTFVDSETENTYFERLAEEAGYSFESIRDHVGSVTNKTHQRLLRDKGRNKTITKTVVDKRGGKEVLIGESDDFVLYTDCASDDRGWFVKRHTLIPNMPERELDFYNCLRNWNPVTDARYDPYFRDMQRNLVTATTLVRLLLD